MVLDRYNSGRNSDSKLGVLKKSDKRVYELISKEHKRLQAITRATRRNKNNKRK